MHWPCSMAQAMLLNCNSWFWTFTALLHWLEQSGPLCLSFKQVCSCSPSGQGHAEMCWSSLVGGFPSGQHVL